MPLRAYFSALAAIICLLFASTASSEGTISGHAWTLDTKASTLNFQSVKNNAIVETSRFSTFEGTFDETGTATILVDLDSIDTGVDLRNVRMRFLFFETYKYPTAKIEAVIDENILNSLSKDKRVHQSISFELTLRGVTRTLIADAVMTMFSDHQVSITTASPVNVVVKDFIMLDGISKLEEAAKVKIVPNGAVSFDFIFNKITTSALQSAGNSDADSLDGDSTEQLKLVSDTMSSAASMSQSKPDLLSLDECRSRFEVLSRTRSINFTYASSSLDTDGIPVLDTVVDISKRCSAIELTVEGHTDSTGSDASNQELSMRRAQSVVAYLTDSGVPENRLTALGVGESRPLVSNDTNENRARNRRIEFVVNPVTVE